MSTQLLNGRLFNRLAGVSLAACAIAIAAPSLRADDVTADQTLIASFIPAPKTINTATAPALAAAVAEAITQTTGSNGFSPAGIAASALEPYPFGSGTAKVRADRNAATGSAVDVAVAAVNVLATHADVTFAADAAAITDSIVAVNPGDSAQDLTKAGQTAVVKSVLEAISTDSVSNGTLLAADEAIGNALATDAYLEGLSGSQLTDVVQGAIAGITGVKGKAPLEAPEAAEDFVQGLLLSGTVPNATSGGATYSSFAVAILKGVAKNTSVDELVAYQVGLAQAAAAPGSAQANLVAIATALFAKYPTATDVVKITQGLTAALPAVDVTEQTRVSFVTSLTSGVVKQATSIAEGATFTDPYFSSEFVGAVLGTVSTVAPTKLTSNATAIATGVGAILGQDGAELTQVAEVYSELTGSGVLAVASAATFVKDLIGGAIKGLPATTPTGVFATVGDGGVLMGSAKHPVATATTLVDLEGIEDLMAAGIVQANGVISSKTEATKLAGELGALAKDIALFVKGQSVNGTLVGESLAGTLAQYISTLGLNTTVGSGKTAYNVQSLIFAAVQAGIDAANPTSAEKALIATAISEAGTGDFAIFGAVNTPESAVTDL